MSLFELIVVLAVVSILISLSGPALQTLLGAGTTNKAISELSGTLEWARAHAMANNTYVRVGICQISRDTGPAEGVLVYPIYSIDGTHSALMNETNWRLLSKPTILTGISVNNTLSSRQSSSNQDLSPGDSSFGTLVTQIPGYGSVTIRQFVEFAPSGEVYVEPEIPVRYIKLGFEYKVGNRADPFILRLATTGSISTLRKEDIL